MCNDELETTPQKDILQSRSWKPPFHRRIEQGQRAKLSTSLSRHRSGSALDHSPPHITAAPFGGSHHCFWGPDRLPPFSSS